MKSVQITRSEIEITKKELADFVAAHLKDAVAEDATVVAGGGPASPSKSLGVVLGLSREKVDGYLRPLIPTLPRVTLRLIGLATFDNQIHHRPLLPMKLSAPLMGLI
jgi:hypothetical protein